MKTFGEKIIQYYFNLSFDGLLPDGISVMNPIRESESIREICKLFYTKYYSDNKKRKLILGINPGRLGAGATGIPFTDTKRLNEICNISNNDFKTHEPSSVFVYDVINAYGGPEKFYGDYYINSVCPLGFTVKGNHQKEINYNYYDKVELQKSVLEFIKWNLKTQLEMGCHNEICFCLGTGKNFKFLSGLNKEEKYFKSIVPLEHPRYIMQYKSKQKEAYIKAFIEKLLPVEF